MVVWEDRGVLKPPKPPIVHATGISTTNIPVHRVSEPVPVHTLPVEVKARKNRKPIKIPSSAIPKQHVVNAPSSSAHVKRHDIDIATDGAKVMHGQADLCSSVGMSRDGTTIKQPSLHTHGVLTRFINENEVGALLSESIQLCLPPKAEPSGNRDSRYSSIASTPVSNSRDPSVNKPALVQSTLKV